MLLRRTDTRTRRCRGHLAAILLLLVASSLPIAPGVVSADGPAGSSSIVSRLCGYAYPSFTRFVIEDGGQDDAGHPLALCTAYQALGGERSLGLPISRPFRVGPDLYQALEYGVLQWREDRQDVVLLDVMDLLHSTGQDPALQRVGIPPARIPDVAWFSDAPLRVAYGDGINPDLGQPTSPPVNRGPYIIQRYQRGILRRWLEPPPYELAGAWTGPEGSQAERLRVGDLLRTADLIPPQALVADPGADAQQYNWSSAPRVPPTFWSSVSQAVGGWSTLFDRGGAFDVGGAGHESDIAVATGMGLRLGVNAYLGRDTPAEQASLDHDLSLVDTYLWGRIETACGARALDQTCSLSPDDLDAIERQVRSHLQVTRKDDSVVAHWILDDYPGDVRPALELIHRLVQEDNFTGRAARPTICGFGGDLDNTAQTLADSRAAFDAAVVNFTPNGCDAVALYPYARGVPVDQDSIDWAMSDLLPYMLNELRQRGWDPSLQPLIGIPQTFALAQSVSPGQSSVATQTTAYCRAGARTILFYAWNDSFAGPKVELFNSPELRSGAETGLSSCQAIWLES